MKRRMLILGCGALLSVFLTTTTACSRKTGCPSFNQKPKSEKAAKRGGKSSLFPKNMRNN